MIVFAHPRLARLDSQDFLLAQAGWLGGGGGAVNLVEAMNDPDMLGPWFHGASWERVESRVASRFRVADGGGVSRLTFTQSIYGDLNRAVGRHQFRKQSVKAPELQRLGHFPVTEIGSRIFKFYQRYFQLANRYRRLHNSIPPPKNHTSAYCKACLTRFLSDVIAHIELCTAKSRRTKTTVCATPEPRPPAGESDAPICHCAALTVLLVFANYWLLRAKKRNPMRLLAATSGVWEW
jgi:hypothetical protein